MAPIPVLHPITRLIIGGAQDTMLTADLLDKGTWAVEVLCGPQTGSEGSLIEAVRARGIPLHIEPTLVREVNPLKDARRCCGWRCACGAGALPVHSTAARRASWAAGRRGSRACP